MATTTTSPGPLARWRTAHASQIYDVRRGLYRFTRNRLSMIGLTLVLLLIVVAITAPAWIPYPDDVTGSVHMDARLKAPSAVHLFGTDEAGRDVFSRTIMATRVSFEVGIVIL